MAFRYTLGATGRDIVNALKSGKSVMVHVTVPYGGECYSAPYLVMFHETQDVFVMDCYVDADYVRFSGGLDDELVYDESGGGIK